MRVTCSWNDSSNAFTSIQKSNRCILLPQMMKNMQIDLEEKKNLRDVMI